VRVREEPGGVRRFDDAMRAVVLALPLLTIAAPAAHAERPHPAGTALGRPGQQHRPRRHGGRQAPRRHPERDLADRRRPVWRRTAHDARGGRRGPGDRRNPPGRGLGERPTTQTNTPRLDAELWINTPGESDGECRQGPPAGQWSAPGRGPDQARERAALANAGSRTRSRGRTGGRATGRRAAARAHPARDARWAARAR